MVDPSSEHVTSIFLAELFATIEIPFVTIKNLDVRDHHIVNHFHSLASSARSVGHRSAAGGVTAGQARDQRRSSRFATVAEFLKEKKIGRDFRFVNSNLAHELGQMLPELLSYFKMFNSKVTTSFYLKNP